MRIEVVNADAFGPFRGERLELSPGLNVLFGPNEAGKSSWHAAIYAGLCGRKRGVGAGTVDAREFAARHRPWTGEEWSASVVIVLENGRRIRIGQDLEGRVDCQATEVALGRDISSEIMFEGTPDGARFLGLDRKAFIATACIRQADLSGVLGDATELQTHLQRAAAAHGTDATAAAAMDTIEAFKREHVGLARANSRKPLQQAIERSRRAQATLDTACGEAETRVERQRAAHDAAVEARRLRAETASIEGALAHSRLRTRRADLSQAETLSAALAVDLPQAPGKAELREARDAVAAWEAAPESAAASGPTARALQTELTKLPEVTTDDEEPAAHVVDTAERLKDVQRRLELLIEDEPSVPEQPVEGVDPAELRMLAASLREPRPPAPPVEPVQSAAVADRLRSRRTALLVTAGVLAAIGIAGFFLEPAAGAVGVVAAIVTVVAAAVTHGKVSAAETSERARDEAENAATYAEQAWRQRRSGFLDRIRALGLPDDPDALVDLAVDVESVERDRAAHEHWQARRAELESGIGDAGLELSAALDARAASAGNDAAERYDRYVADCAVARRRREVRGEIAAREKVEAVEARSEKSAERLRTFARSHEIAAERHPDLIAMDVKGWIVRAEEALDHLNEVEHSRVELGTLLRGRSLEQLRSDVQGLEDQLVDATDAESTVGTPNELEGRLRRARIDARIAEERANTLKGELTEYVAGLTPVADAEEELRAASEDLDRLERLAETLETAHRFLDQAQDRVHRDIAPVLNATIDAYVSRITGGHYVSAAVDPSTLAVRVVEAGGQYRDATQLSHGTAEQIYLLLRVALAEHLTIPGEVCPLILDDVTVQSDVTRTRAILEVLEDLAEDRQIILFTQEDDVFDWAENRLVGPRHRVEYLSL